MSCVDYIIGLYTNGTIRCVYMYSEVLLDGHGLLLLRKHTLKKAQINSELIHE